MTLMLIALLFPILQNAPSAAAPVGRADAGKAAWVIAGSYCWSCHGNNGEGGFGPDLAGRALTWEQFKRAVRKPWGVMPAYTETQLPDQRLADMYAYLMGSPKVGEAAPQRVSVTATTSPAQATAIQTIGCIQCHQAEMAIPRRYIGGEGGDYNMLVDLVFNHTKTFPMGRMGNYSTLRVPDATLQQIWKFMSSETGLRVPVDATIDAGVAAGANKTYTLTVTNSGKAGKGLTAEDITVSANLPAGVTVVTSTGAGYKGTRAGSGGGTIASWQLPKLAAGEKQALTLTLAGTGADLFKGLNVVWMKPEIRRPGPADRAAGFPDVGDGADFVIARPTAAAQ